ncbi:uncharacterized protein LOC125861414 [Solanum stenotomum]|uniref:uncharacterized protein LOC125861414 n=1 Tax=Solanum stenotomum TaxID=172797 RepID=UPI0020D1959D|nr:uncharacterized protein LOC125861414 [Solanum stenotomum]
MAIDKIKLKKMNAQRPLHGFNSRPLQLAQQPHHNQEGVAPASLVYNEKLNLLLPFMMQKFAPRLQFLEEDSSGQSTPLEKLAYEGNMEVKEGLPVGYWSSEVLSKVASLIGKPLYTYSFTVAMARISYARVPVETVVSQPLLDSIEMVTATGSFKQAVEYDWCPKFCTECMKFRHYAKACWTKVEGKQEEPQFQEVKKKKHRNKRQKAPQPRYDWKAKGEIVQMRLVASKPDKEEGTWAKKNKVDVMGVVETRGKVHKVGNILKKMVTDWMHCLNSPMAYNGRVWLLWKDHIQVHILVVHEQFINCKISDKTSPFSSYFTVVYAKNESQQREDLWRELVQIGGIIQEAWLLTGNFNNVLTTDDRLGFPVMQEETQAFQDCIDTLQLTTLKQIRWHFTFCNKQHDVNRVYSKIDWVMGNFSG